MKNVAVYMRVGNKEQIDTRGQERKIPTPEELEAEGYEIVTLPKKKAWLYMRSSVGIPDTERNARMNILRAQAEHRGYEVVGETTVIGASYNSSPAIDNLLNNEFKREGVDVLFMRGIRDMSFQIAESIEIYDKVTDKGYELRTADGSDAVFTAETEHGMKWRKIFEQMSAGQRAEEAEQTESDEDQDVYEAPTMSMGGEMQ
ncbi:MAG: recombinase family protein [Clostridia bacterium]|jgi:DNA invertase Pin-like site-specific DNA recombinase|nr:recombinase family protein [Clostridia bacterium]